VFVARHADRVGEEGWLLMTETLKGMSSMPKDAKKTTGPGEAERAAVGSWSRLPAPAGRT